GVGEDAVRGLVEVARLDVRLDRRGDRLSAEHHRPEERLFGFEVVGRNPTGARYPARSATTIRARSRCSRSRSRSRWAPSRIVERLNQSGLPLVSLVAELRQ